MNMFSRLKAHLQNIVFLSKRLGLLGTVLLKIQQLRSRKFRMIHPYTLISKYAKYPLKCRPNTSDTNVFKQIFIEREYSCLDNVSNVGLVIDCGANVGYSSAYFLTHFPSCKVITVEPDPSNFMMLKRNLAPYKERATLIHSAIWSHPIDLKISETPYRNGKEWTKQVRKCTPNETPDIKGTDIKTLLKESGYDKISILKMDIEGTEAIVFSANYDSWLACVDNIVIELHNDSYFGQSSDIFFSAISDRNFDISKYKELTICKSRAKQNAVPDRYYTMLHSDRQFVSLEKMR